MNTPLRTLYPSLEPHRSGFLRVSPVHEIYWEESGNPSGKPALFVHGGPGAGAGTQARRFFDPEAYRRRRFQRHVGIDDQNPPSQTRLSAKKSHGGSMMIA
jgi:hypothetical protein